MIYVQNAKCDKLSLEIMQKLHELRLNVGALEAAVPLWASILYLNFCLGRIVHSYTVG